MNTQPLSELEAESNRVEGNTEHFLEVFTRAQVDLAKYRHITPDQAREILPRQVWGPIREGTLTLLGGESKARKSWFALDFAMHAVTGAAFLGMESPQPAAGERRAVILDFELLETNLVSRFVTLSGRWWNDTEESAAIWGRITLHSYRRLMGEAVDWIGHICQVARTLARGDLLVADCLQPIFDGDTNHPGEVRRALARLQAAATESGCAILLVDHFSKSTEAKGKNRLSGSMAKSAAPDCILLMEGKGGEFVELGFELRMDPPRDAVLLAFESATTGFRLVPEVEAAARREAAAQARQDERMVRAMPEAGTSYTRKEMAGNAGVHPNTIDNWLPDFGDSVEVLDGNPKRFRRNP